MLGNWLALNTIPSLTGSDQGRAIGFLLYLLAVPKVDRSKTVLEIDT
jgi:hypothetical protein